MDKDNVKKKHNNHIMRNCDGNGNGNDHDDNNEDDANSNDDNRDDDNDGSGNGDGGGVRKSNGGAIDNNQLKLQKRWRLQLGNGWVTASQRQRQG